MSKRKQYRTPKIIRNKSGDWYIQYYYRDPMIPSKWIPFKERKGINYIKDAKDKEIAAEDLRKDVEAWLYAGNSPFNEVPDIAEQIGLKEVDVDELKKGGRWTIEVAIQKFKDYVIKQNLAKRTRETYFAYLRPLEQYITSEQQEGLLASEIIETWVVDFLDKQSTKQDWSARTYNNHLEFYSSFFKRCYKLEKMVRRRIVYECIFDDIELKKTTPQRNKAFTSKQLKAIRSEAEKRGYYNLKDYLEWIGLSSMRPAEIRSLKFSDIDEQNRQIRIIGKTGDRLIPIPDQLLALIDKRSEKSTSLNDYVFGMAGTVSDKRMSVMYFLEQFAEIRKSLGLPNTFTIYSMKPTGIIMMIKAGFKDEQIRQLTGHKTQVAFEAYKRDLVIDSKAMKGSTIDFWEI